MGRRLNVLLEHLCEAIANGNFPSAMGITRRIFLLGGEYFLLQVAIYVLQNRLVFIFYVFGLERLLTNHAVCSGHYEDAGPGNNGGVGRRSEYINIYRLYIELYLTDLSRGSERRSNGTERNETCSH
jgi:hypothetical protein